MFLDKLKYPQSMNNPDPSLHSPCSSVRMWVAPIRGCTSSKCRSAGLVARAVGHTYIYTCDCMCVCEYVCVYIYIYIYLFTHIYKLHIAYNGNRTTSWDLSKYCNNMGLPENGVYRTLNRPSCVGEIRINHGSLEQVTPSFKNKTQKHKLVCVHI